MKFMGFQDYFFYYSLQPPYPQPPSLEHISSSAGILFHRNLALKEKGSQTFKLSRFYKTLQMEYFAANSIKTGRKIRRLLLVKDKETSEMGVAILLSL